MRENLSTIGSGTEETPLTTAGELLDLAGSLFRARTPTAVAETVVEYVHRELGALGASIAIVSRDGPEIRVLAIRGLCHVPDRLRNPVGSEPLSLADAMREGKSLWIESPTDLSTWYADEGKPDGGPALSAVAVVPLRGDDEVIGALAMSFPEERPPLADPAVVRWIAGQCSVALRRVLAADAERNELAERRAAHKRQSHLLAVLSHELRTPLNAILGFTTLVTDEVAGPVTTLQRNHLGRVKACAHHLLLLVEDILTLQRINGGHVTVHSEAASIATVMREAAGMVEYQASAKGLLLRVEAPSDQETDLIDATKVRQILVNLLSNAIKFTDRGGVELSGRRDHGHLILQVRDTGVGIAPNDLGRIFDPFWQVADRDETQRRGGIGLGLDVSARIARVMGGKLTAASSVGEGSTFTLILPRGHPG